MAEIRDPQDEFAASYSDLKPEEIRAKAQQDGLGRSDTRRLVQMYHAGRSQDILEQEGFVLFRRTRSLLHRVRSGASHGLRTQPYEDSRLR